MSRVISVVTAAYQPVPEYLTAAYESLRSQSLPEGWQWQWVVQEDGRISSGSGRRTGEAATRTMCLSRATGDLIKVLDSDDQLMPGTLAREIDVLTRQPEIGWTTTRVLDLLPDGSTAGFASDPPEGKIELGQVLAHWRSHNYRAQVHPVTLCMRRNLII